MLLGAQEADGIVDDQISLYVFREVAAGDKFQSGGRSYHVIFFDQVGSFEVPVSITRKGRSWKHPVDIRAGGFGIEVLSPLVKGNAPRVRYADLVDTLQLVTLGLIAVKAPICRANRAVGSFYVGMQKHPFSHVDRTAFICGKCRNRMVCVMIIKSTQENFFSIGFVVFILIDQ